MFADIVAASAALDLAVRPAVAETPLARRPAFDRSGIEILAKLENLQPTGSFKLRGATAKMLSLDDAARDAGVVAASTGNHGAAVAASAASIGVAAEVFVSTEADAAKVAAIRERHAVVTEIPGDPVEAELAARRRATETGRTYVSPYNDITVVAGQGTIAVELLRQDPGLAAVVVAVGGGGLISGVAATLKHHRPELKVIAASAANSAAMHHSVAAGRIVDVDHLATLSEGTAGGIERRTVTFDMCRRLVDDWVLVEEAPIAAAMRRYMSCYEDPIEGSAGLALAAAQRIDVTGRVAVVICGGNVSKQRLYELNIAAR